MTTRSKLVSFTAGVMRRVAENPYDDLRPAGSSVHPIPFFGDPRAAKVLTLGVNPSATEFRPNRGWPVGISAEQLTDRLLAYFAPDGAVAPHPWFEGWQRALEPLGVSYRDGTFHSDLTPRATRSLGSLEPKQLIRFERMARIDAHHLCDLLELCPEVRLVMAAGAVTKRQYMIEFLVGLSCVRSMTVKPRKAFKRVPGVRGGVGLYEFTLGGVQRLLFFCASSPSDRRNPDVLPRRVAGHAATLLESLRT